MPAPLTADLAIIGSGFGGSLLALVARQCGLRVALLERGRHPRFAIGESASPLAGVVLEQLAARYDLPEIAPLAAYGSWTRQYPQLTCGVKRGFTYYKHEAGRPFRAQADRGNELLVAASPNETVADTHWLRADVDQFLVGAAMARGVTYIDELALDHVEWRADDVIVSGVRRGAATRIRAPFVVDASGAGGVLSRALGLTTAGFDGYPATQALFSHFTGVAPCRDLPEFASAADPPYPVDAAALHHVFDDGWMWVLRFDNGVTSAGVAVTEALAADLRLRDGAAAWRRLLARYPSIAAQFADAVPVREFTWMPRLAWRTSPAAGERWALLPSAAAFVDPLFSTGMPLTLFGVERLGRWFEARAGADLTGDAALVGYARRTLREADHVARFVRGCFAAFPRFDTFTAWSMFYFAAASFSELSRRLHGDGWSRGFLCAEMPDVVEAMAALSPAGGVPDEAAFASRVAAAIAPFNVAGLADPAKRNWYGVDVEDAVRAASRLGAAPERVRRVSAGSA